jgi:hypothetical protein
MNVALRSWAAKCWRGGMANVEETTIGGKGGNTSLIKDGTILSRLLIFSLAIIYYKILKK